MFHMLLHFDSTVCCICLALLLCCQEEEQCYHLADINREREVLLQKHVKIEEKMLKHRYLEDHLAHLNTTKAWE